MYYLTTLTIGLKEQPTSNTQMIKQGSDISINTLISKMREYMLTHTVAVMHTLPLCYIDDIVQTSPNHSN